MYNLIHTKIMFCSIFSCWMLPENLVTTGKKLLFMTQGGGCSPTDRMLMGLANNFTEHFSTNESRCRPVS